MSSGTHAKINFSMVGIAGLWIRYICNLTRQYPNIFQSSFNNLHLSPATAKNLDRMF